MPGLSVRHTDWLNENAYRAFPLADDSSRDIPHGLLVDMAMPVPMDLISPDTVFLRSLVGFGEGVVLSFASSSAPDQILATATVFNVDHELNKSYVLVGTARIDGAVGRVNIGLPSALQEASGLNLDFSSTPELARVVPSAIRPAIRGLTSLSVFDADGGSAGALTGSINLRAGLNMSLSVVGNTVVLSSGLLDSGIDQDSDCGCGFDEEAPRPCIRSINGVLPDSQGNVQISGSDNLDVVVGGGALQIDDSSTTPCCECDQVDVLYQAVQAVESEMSQLQTVNEQIRGRIDNMNAVLAAAALNPPPSEG